jgi:predicted MPP superfamily phosphohydrolase
MTLGRRGPARTKKKRTYAELLVISLIISVFLFVNSAFAFSSLPSNLSSTTETYSSDDSFSFVAFGDNQEGHAVFNKLIKRVNNEKGLSFAISLGDMVDEPTRKEYQNYLEMVSKLKLKLYTVPGNHDLAGNGYKNYQEYFGPFYYSFDYKNSHFIVLNNAFKVSFHAKQFNWLKNDLAKTDKENIFVLMHRPTFDPTEIYSGYVMSGRETVAQLMEVFEKNGVDYVLAGHIHGYARVKRNGVVYIVSGGAGGRLHLLPAFGGFHHYIRIDVKGNQISDKVVRI